LHNYNTNYYNIVSYSTNISNKRTLLLVI